MSRKLQVKKAKEDQIDLNDSFAESQEGRFLAI